MEKLTFALQEERLRAPLERKELFVGRKKELERLLQWTAMVKEELSQSMAILARRKKGKTALVQRFYNHVYTTNDPQVIPFYFNVPEFPISMLDYSDLFYRSLITQYLAFKQRKLEWTKKEVLSYEELKSYAQKDEVLLRDLGRMQNIQKEQQIDQSWEYATQAGHRISGLKGERVIQIIA